MQWVLCLFLALTNTGIQAENRLADNSSPYLALHGHDPVHWQPWEAGVLERARREQKLVLVSIGYFACHWCHVMQRESFRDTAIAGKLNDGFIAVKVDRELEPVLDQRLMDFAQTVNGNGGWPLNVFLTPDGHPLSAVLYLPPAEFSAYLDKLGAQWRERREVLSRAAGDMSKRLAALRIKRESTEGQPLVASLDDRFVKSALAEADRLQGGFGQQTKFPSMPQLWALLELQQRRPLDEVDAFLRATLRHMADGGLYDHIGGGFFRYTTDPDWRTPHFEKMLYDNALLAWLYLRAAEVLNDPGFRRIGLATLRFIVRDMGAKGGAFVASLSAVDGKGEEGGHYLWQQAELAKRLSEDDLHVANLVWGLSQPASWNAGALAIPASDLDRVASELGIGKDALRGRVESVREKLLTARTDRSLPRDEKCVTGWNGLALRALAEGVRHAPELKPAGEALARFLHSRWKGRVLQRAVDARGQGLGAGTLGDYANVANGLIAWAGATGDASARRTGVELLRAAAKTFHSADGWRDDPTDLLPGSAPRTHIPDTVLPSPESLWIEAARQAAARGPDAALSRLMASIPHEASLAMSREPFWYGSLIASFR